jgi:hypothetical protein
MSGTCGTHTGEKMNVYRAMVGKLKERDTKFYREVVASRFEYWGFIKCGEFLTS